MEHVKIDKEYDFLIKMLNHKQNKEDKINHLIIETYPNCSPLFQNMYKLFYHIDLMNVSQMLSDLHSLKGHARNMGLFKLGAIYHNLESVFAFLSKSENQDEFLFRKDKIYSIAEKIIETVHFLHKNYLNGNFSVSLDEIQKDKAHHHDYNQSDNYTFSIKEKQLSNMIDKAIQNRMELQKINSFHQNIINMSNEIQNRLNSYNLDSELKFLLDKYNSLLERNLTKASSNLLNQNKNIDNLIDSFLKVRLVPISAYTDEFYEVVRLVTSSQNKHCELEIIGEHLQIDKSVMDKLSFAIGHLLRNAISHGIENEIDRIQSGKSKNGKIKLEFQQIGNFLSISISDDGCGINIDKVKEIAKKKLKNLNNQNYKDNDWANLIFISGFTTRDYIDEYAGRGVGLDSVKKTLLDLNGQITVTTKKNIGSTFKISLPTNQFLSNFIIVENGGYSYAIPQYLIETIITLKSSFYQQYIKGKEFVNLAHILESYSGKTIDNPQYQQIQSTTLPDLLNETSFVTNVDKYTTIVLNYLNEKMILTIDSQYQKKEALVENVGSIQNVKGVIGVINLYNNKQALVINPILLLNNFNKDLELNDNIKQFGYALIVDDSKMACLTTQHSLKKMGVKSISKEDGQIAIDFLLNTEQLPNIILTDFEMPNMNGMEFSKAIKSHEKLKHIPILMITSKSLENYKQEATNIGIEYIFGKPFHESKLQEFMTKYNLC